MVHHINDPSWRKIRGDPATYARFTGRWLRNTKVELAIFAALVRRLRRQRVSATGRRSPGRAFSAYKDALQIYAPGLDVDGFILNAAAGVDKVPHRHLPLYGVAH